VISKSAGPSMVLQDSGTGTIWPNRDHPVAINTGSHTPGDVRGGTPLSTSTLQIPGRSEDDVVLVRLHGGANSSVHGSVSRAASAVWRSVAGW
jgi:hypothetical protein